MKKYFNKAIVASGHRLVSEAGATILSAGGNAFDAVVAAGLASTVVEQTLTSLGGGGYLLGYSGAEGQSLLFDFFVDTPGRGRGAAVGSPHFFPVTVQFAGAPQIFNIGLGAVAVPGVAKGLLHTHRRLGRMPLAEVAAPAIDYARGHRLNRFQASFLRLLHPIVTRTETGRSLYGCQKTFVGEGDRLENHELAFFLEMLVEDGGESFYRGDIAAAMVREMKENGGLLTAEDLEAYRVIERRPLRLNYRDKLFLTCPPPSMGGPLIALSLKLYAACSRPDFPWGGREHLLQTVTIMREVDSLRRRGILSPEHLQSPEAEEVARSLAAVRRFSRGTTHISIADKEGNCAAMTCSNGEGCGWFAPGTGVMLNNMMGEDDLHPDGFHTAPAGERVASMMAPSMLLDEDGVRLVLGSGGSKRIRTAITQVLSQVLDFERGLQQAVVAPRLYWDGECLQVEPGFDRKVLQSLDMEMNIWQAPDVYFGGVHAVIPGREGAGDPRRGGCVVEVK